MSNMSRKKEVIDLDFDPDILSDYLNNLTLNPNIKDLSGSLDSLENQSTENDLEAKNEQISNIFIKHEILSDSDNESDPTENKNQSSCVNVKKEDNAIFADFGKTELSSDSDDSSTDLRERGREPKKRSTRRKQKDKPYYVDTTCLNQHSLLHHSHGRIIENNFNNLQPEQFGQFTIPDLDSSSFLNVSLNSLETNFTNQVNFINSPESGYETSQSSEVFSPSPPLDYILDSERTLKQQLEIENIVKSFDISFKCSKINSNSAENFINSPESGYETSQSSEVFSPSSCLDDILEGTLEEQLEIENIVENILEIENSDNNTIQNQNCILPVSNDSNNYDLSNVEGIKAYLKELENLINGEEHSFNRSASISLLKNSSESSSPNPHKRFSQNQQNNSEKYKSISYEIQNVARQKLSNSNDVDKIKMSVEQRKILLDIKKREECDSEIKIIDYEEEIGKENLKRTNLHNAVLNKNIEKVLSLVEFEKLYHLPLTFNINTRDVYGKTALDYAIEKKMNDVIDYLKENKAVTGI